MEKNLLTVLIGIAAGAVGYWLSTFHIQPILRFHEVRNQVLMDFIYYAQVINSEGLNEEMQKLYHERVLANRKASAQLFAATQGLPWWYRRYLKLRKWEPEEAARRLIGFSNTNEYKESARIQAHIREKIGLPPEI